MAAVQWIKITTNIFENRKIKQIEKLPDGDAIIVIWVRLLCLAGTVNDSGVVRFTDKIPYTDEMLSSEFNKPISTIRLALNTFIQYSMIEMTDTGYIYLPNWEKYQNEAKLADMREYNRIKKRESRARAKQKLASPDAQQQLPSPVIDTSMTSQKCQGVDKNRIRKEDILSVKDAFLETCISLPKIQSIKGKRESTVKARLKEYGLDTIMDVFVKVEESDWLAGRSGTWKASFDWIMDPNNFIKIMEDTYKNQASQNSEVNKIDW